MKIFNLDKTYNIVCNWKNTRNGFKHEAVLLKNNNEVYKTKICYLNRTWERFEYEDILIKIINDYFDKNNAFQYQKNLQTMY